MGNPLLAGFAGYDSQGNPLVPQPNQNAGGNPLLTGFAGYDQNGNRVTPSLGTVASGPNTGNPHGVGSGLLSNWNNGSGTNPTGAGTGVPVTTTPSTSNPLLSGWVTQPWHQQSPREMMLNSLLSEGYTQYGRGAILTENGTEQYNPYWSNSQKNSYAQATGNNNLATAVPAGTSPAQATGGTTASTNNNNTPEWANNNPLLTGFYPNNSGRVESNPYQVYGGNTPGNRQNLSNLY